MPPNSAGDAGMIRQPMLRDRSRDRRLHVVHRDAPALRHRWWPQEKRLALERIETRSTACGAATATGLGPRVLGCMSIVTDWRNCSNFGSPTPPSHAVRSVAWMRLNSSGMVTSSRNAWMRMPRSMPSAASARTQ